MVVLVISCSIPTVAHSIPYFARKYDVPCSQCHVAPPKLNAFGELFVAHRYERPELTPRLTWPFAVWVSGRSEGLPGAQASDNYRAYVNRVEVISGGNLLSPWFSYFVEWRPVSLEARSDGTLRDRSGRFEDLFLIAANAGAELIVGQFRQIAQVDVSRRLGLSEPLVLSSSLPGQGGGTARERSLRGFSPAGRSPSVRAAWNTEVLGDWRWTTAAAVPVPGEFSIPLTEKAKTEASNEVEWRRKGFVAETFVRRGLASFGAHGFYDDSERYLANAVTTGSYRPLYWTGIMGAAKSASVVRGQWSVEAEYVPHYFFALGARVEDRAADFTEPAFLPYVNVHFPGTRSTARLTIERRIQTDRDATFVELGVIF